MTTAERATGNSTLWYSGKVKQTNKKLTTKADVDNGFQELRGREG